MKPKASLKSWNVTLREMASRPLTSLQPSSLASALLRALPVNLSGMGVNLVDRPDCATNRSPAATRKGGSNGLPKCSSVDPPGGLHVLVAQHRHDPRHPGA